MFRRKQKRKKPVKVGDLAAQQGVAAPQAVSNADKPRIPQVQVDMFIDLQDEDGKWLEAEIVEKQGNKIYCHYFDWGDDWNEWVDLEKEPYRINDFRTYCGRRKTRLYKVGQLVEIWQTKRVKKPTWLAGRVQKIDGKQVLVKYTIGFGSTETDMFWFDAGNNAIRKSTDMNGPKTAPKMGLAPKRRARPPNDAMKQRIRMEALAKMAKAPKKDRSDRVQENKNEGSDSESGSDESGEWEEGEEDIEDGYSDDGTGSIYPESQMSGRSGRSARSAATGSVRSAASVRSGASGSARSARSQQSARSARSALSGGTGVSDDTESIAESAMTMDSVASGYSQYSDDETEAPKVPTFVVDMSVDVRDRDGRWLPATVRDVRSKPTSSGGARQQVKVKVFGPANDRWNEWVNCPHEDDPDDVVQRLAGHGRFSEAGDLKRGRDAARSKATFKLGARVIVYQLALPRRWIVGRVLDTVGCQVKVEFAPTTVDKGVKREKLRFWFHTLLDEVRLGQAKDAELMNSGEDLEEGAIDLGIKVRKKLLPKSLDEGAWIDVKGMKDGKWRGCRIGEDDDGEDRVKVYYVDEKGDETGEEEWFSFEWIEEESRQFEAKTKGKEHPAFKVDTRVDVRHPDGEEGWKNGKITEVDGPQVYVDFADEKKREAVGSKGGYWGHTLDGDIRLEQRGGAFAHLKKPPPVPTDGAKRLGYRRPDERDAKGRAIDMYKFVNFECAELVPPRNLLGITNFNKQTSFMNAILQVFCSLPSVVDYFVNKYVPPLAVETDVPIALGVQHDFYPTKQLPPRSKDRAMKYLKRPERLTYQIFRIVKRLHQGRFGIYEPGDRRDALQVEPLLVQQDAHRKEFPAFKEKEQDLRGYFEALTTVLHRALDDGDDVDWPDPAPWDEDQEAPIPLRSDLFWRYFHKESNSFLIDIIYGIRTLNLGCAHCKRLTSVFEPMNSLFLKIPCPKYTATERKKVASSRMLRATRPGMVGLHDCLGAHFRLDSLDGDKPVSYCEVCRARRPHMQRHGMARFPNVLFMFFNRHHLGNWLKTRVAYPIDLNMKQHLDHEEENNIEYTLTAVLNQGAPEGVQKKGRRTRLKAPPAPVYTAYVRVKRAGPDQGDVEMGHREGGGGGTMGSTTGGKMKNAVMNGVWDWVEFKDKFVRVVDEDDVRKPNVGLMLLVYERMVPNGVMNVTRGGRSTTKKKTSSSTTGSKNFKDAKRGDGPSEDLIRGLGGSSRSGRSKKSKRSSSRGRRDSYSDDDTSSRGSSKYDDSSSMGSSMSGRSTGSSRSGRSSGSSRSGRSTGSSKYSRGSSRSGRSGSSKGSRRSGSSKRSRGSSRGRDRGYDDYDDY